MPRLRGVRERRDHVIALHIPVLEHGQPFRYQEVTGDETLVIMDVCAETPHVTVSVSPRVRVWERPLEPSDQFIEKTRVTGPWLVSGNREPHFLSEMLMVAQDAAQEGRSANVVDIMRQVAEGERGHGGSSLMRPLIIGVRCPWYATVSLNDGVPAQNDVHVWLRCLVTRDFA